MWAHTVGLLASAKMSESLNKETYKVVLLYILQTDEQKTWIWMKFLYTIS